MRFTRNSLTIFFVLLLIASSCNITKSDQLSQEPSLKSTIGLQAWSFRYYFPKDIPGTLDRVQSMGITELEMGIGSGKLPPEEYRKLCEDRDINIRSFGTSFESLEEDLGGAIQEAKILGADYVMCARIPHEKGEFSLAVANNAIRVFNKAGKAFRKNGLTFCYHPHGYEFVPHQNGTLLDYIIRETDPKYVSFEMDLQWVQDPIKLLEKYGDRWKLMHLRDIKKGKSVTLGTGEYDLFNILRTANKAGIQYYFIEDTNHKEVENQLPLSIDYLKHVNIPDEAWTYLLDDKLSNWEPFIGVPYICVEGIDSSKKSNKFNIGKPLGLNNDPKKIFSVIKEKKEPILRASGEIFGALTSKESYANYHLKLQYKWGDKKWPPRMNSVKDSGIMFHCSGEHGVIWNVFMKGLEYQIAEKKAGDAYAVGGANAKIYALDTLNAERKRFLHAANGKAYTIGMDYGALSVMGSSSKGENKEEWTTVEIYCIKDTAVFLSNSSIVNFLTDSHSIIDGQKIALEQGKIQLQSSSAEIYFKDIKIRSVDKFPAHIKAACGF